MPRAGLLVALLAMATGIGPFAVQTLVPLLPRLGAQFAGTPQWAVQLSLTLSLFGVALGQLGYGPISDRFGRRLVLLAGMGVFVAGSALCLVAPNIPVLVAGRVLQALGGAAGAVLARAVLGDLFDRDRAAAMLAYVTMAFAAAPAMGPGVGAAMGAALGWRSLFVLAVALGIIIALGIARLLPETHFQRQVLPSPRRLARSWRHLLADRNFTGYTLQTSAMMAVFLLFIAGAPHLMVEILGYSELAYALWFILVEAGFILGNLLCARLTATIGFTRMIRLGSGLSLGGAGLMLALALIGLRAPWALFVPMTLQALGAGMSIANATAGAESTDPQRAGTASGLLGFTQMLVAGLASTALGFFLGASIYPVIVALVLAALAAFLAAALVIRPRPEEG